MKKLYSRKILQNIKKWLLEKEIVILNGPRQVGKTSLLKLLKKELVRQGVTEKNIFYLNLEEFNILSDLNEDPKNLLKYIVDKGNKNYFLIDEIQYLDNPSNFLKQLYDEYSEKIKIIVTGSSSLELKAVLQDSLAGRKVSFLVKPLDFKEYLQFKEFDSLKYLDKKDIPAQIKDNFDKQLEEYLIYGGMPAVVLQSDYQKKQKMLNEYINTYINKDIRSIGKINSISSFNAVVRILASQIGNLLNISDLSNNADISRRKVERYIDLLEYTFVLNKVIPFYKNTRKQIVKMPKVYFFDVGIRNAILGNFLSMENRQDRGEIFENFVFLELKGISDDNKIFFYRTVSGSEIDFVLEIGGLTQLVEVKYKRVKKQIDTRVLRGFNKNNKVENMFIVSLDSIKPNELVKYIDYRSIRVISSLTNSLKN